MIDIYATVVSMAAHRDDVEQMARRLRDHLTTACDGEACAAELQVRPVNTRKGPLHALVTGCVLTEQEAHRIADIIEDTIAGTPFGTVIQAFGRSGRLFDRVALPSL